MVGQHQFAHQIDELIDLADGDTNRRCLGLGRSGTGLALGTTLAQPGSSLAEKPPPERPARHRKSKTLPPPRWGSSRALTFRRRRYGGGRRNIFRLDGNVITRYVKGEQSSRSSSVDAVSTAKERVFFWSAARGDLPRPGISREEFWMKQSVQVVDGTDVNAWLTYAFTRRWETPIDAGCGAAATLGAAADGASLSG